MSRRIVFGTTLLLLLIGTSVLAMDARGTHQSYLKNNIGVSGLIEKHVTLLFDKPQITEIGPYQWLRIENCSYFTAPHQPMLPVKSLTIELPEKSTVADVRVVTEEAPLSGSFSILPVPSPIIAGSAELGEISEDPTIYSDYNPFPRDRYTYREFHGIDAETSTRVKYIALNLFPLRFFPIRNQVTWTTKISITISYSQPLDVSTPMVTLRNLIITSPTLEPYAVELAKWKNNTGIPSKVVITTWIYNNYVGVDQQEKIRNCIKDTVATYGITYVTIFGDADQVPIRYVYVPDGQDTYTPTDLYYADLDGTWDDNHDGLYADQRYDYVDGVPDVYIGRIPPSLPEYARAAVDKIEGYQKHFDTSENWTQRIILAAGTCSGDGFSNKNKNGTTVLQEYIAKVASDKNIAKLYESAGNLSTANMASEVNEGALFLSFAGHGDPDSGFFSVGWLFYWVIPGLWWNGYGIADVQKLTNGYKLPVVTTMSCSTARFDDTDCLAEWFVLEPHGGSIGYFGATRVAWAYFDEWAPYGLMGEMERRIYENFYNGSTRLGQMWGTSVSQYVQSHVWNYAYASEYDVKTFMEFVLLGDPTLNVGQELDSSTLYQETVRDKPQSGSSWSVVGDSSSYSSLVMKAASSSHNGGCLFGPYITTDWNGESMAGRSYAVNFTLKVSSNQNTNNVVYLDVCYDHGTVIQSMTIKASDFALPNVWQDFQLDFVVPNIPTSGLEFRVVNLNSGVTDVFADKIAVRREWNDSTIYLEGAYNKFQSGFSWSRVQDASSLSGLVMKATNSTANGGCLFGPYITTDWNGIGMAGKPYIVTFRLKVSTNLPLSDVVSVDVCFNAGTILQSMKARASDFALSNTWQDFQLTFVAPSTLAAGLEFRVTNLNNGVADILVDRVIVKQDTSVVYLEDTRNKPQSGSSWARVSDSSSLSGTAMKASAFSLNGATLFGPYITAGWDEPSMLAKPYVATFRLKASSNLPTDNIVYLDVCYNRGTVVQSKMVRASDFAASNTWQDFQLTFIVPDDLVQGLEFRIVNFNHGLADVFADKIAVRRGWEAPVVFVESAFNKLQYGNSWFKVQDASSLSGLVMKATNSTANGGCLFGPYITTDWNGQSMLGKSYTVTYRLKVSSNASSNDVASVDVAYNAGTVIQSMMIRASDFSSPNAWQDFKIAFVTPNSLITGLEFRVLNWNNGVANVYVDTITVKQV